MADTGTARHVAAITLCLLLAAAWWFMAPAQLGGQTSFVTTHGDSMEPQFHAGDLALLRPSGNYKVGDVVAYNSDVLQTVVMHRIVAVDGGHFTFQGDNNSWLDPEQLSKDQLIGGLALQIPQGGVWLEWLTSPLALALITFAVLATGGSAALAVKRRSRRNRRKRALMSRHTTDRPASFPAFGTLPPTLRTSVTISLVLGVLGFTLGAFAWAGPLDSPGTNEVKSGTRMDFSYSADVGTSPAYDETTATSPDPIFRKLTETVDVRFAYHGEPGSIRVAAELSTAGGWHSTLQLAEPVTFTGQEHEGSVRLDLKQLEAKAQAASAVTGLAANPVTVIVRPVVTTASGAEFRPELTLNLTPLQLSLADGEEALTVINTSTVQQAVVVPRMLGVNGWNITAATARISSAVLVLAALATAVVVIMFARRTAPRDEGAAIRRRYAALLVRVHPMPAPQGRPVIDVTTFATLAKLAERYGLLVLHWTRSDVETFVVQDESITYRYRTGAKPPTAADPAVAPNFIDTEA